MRDELLLSFDLGTTSTKVALFNAAGRVLASSSHEYELITPRPGFYELPVEVSWEACVRGIQECLRTYEGRRVRAIGLASQGQTFVAILESMPIASASIWNESTPLASVQLRSRGLGDGAQSGFWRR